jgi:Fic family protein
LADSSDQDRHSIPIPAESLPPLTNEEIANQEATNTLLQFDRVVELISEANSSPKTFRLRPSVILELNRIAIDRIEAAAGRWREEPVGISNSKHKPPPWKDVSRHVDEMCEYVNDNWQSQSAFHLAAYVMWRLNWIHPFIDGNGRTTRAVSYYVLCVKLGFHMPGVTTVPELIAGHKSPYYNALEAADDAAKSDKIDVSEMEDLIKNLLARQMTLALERADSK